LTSNVCTSDNIIKYDALILTAGGIPDMEIIAAEAVGALAQAHHHVPVVSL
jgi:hypothetical protein